VTPEDNPIIDIVPDELAVCPVFGYPVIEDPPVFTSILYVDVNTEEYGIDMLFVVLETDPNVITGIP
jgi:hypothetical protein